MRTREPWEAGQGVLPSTGPLLVLDRPPAAVAPPPDRRGVLHLAAATLALAALLFAARGGLIDPHDQYDLRIYFGAITWWEHGNDLYGYGVADPVMGLLGFTYPPFAAVLMAPMAALGWRAVQGLTVVGIIVAGLVMVHLCLGERIRLPRTRAWPVIGLATGAAFLLQPFRQTLGMGQINLFLAVLVLADVLVLDRLDGRRAGRWAGVGIGLAMAIKIVPGIFLVYLLVARRWRAMAVAGITCASCWLLGALVAPAASWQYFTALLWNTGRVGVPAAPSNQSLYGLIARIAAPTPPSLVALVLLVVPVGALAIRRMSRAVRAGDTMGAVTITGLLGVLACPISWTHHCVWVLPALVVIGHRAALVVRNQVQAGRVEWTRLLLPGGLLLSGLLVLVPDTRAMFNLPFANLVALSPLQIFASSLTMAWMLVAMLALPIADGRPHALSDGRPPAIDRPHRSGRRSSAGSRSQASTSAVC